MIFKKKVDSFISPADIGHVPMKISGFAGFTAEQWKNWIMFYSLVGLKDVLTWQHYNCWHLFIKVCFLLCRQHTPRSGSVDFQILQLFKQLYGAQSVQ